MPELEWIGKQHVLGLAARVPKRSLRHIPDLSLSPGSENAIIHGDNLLALKALLPDYRDRVKMIFIDPPYNADGERWVYNDLLGIPGAERLVGEVGVEGEDSLRHDKWLCMMYPRLVLLRELLEPEGTISISIGDNELHHLRMLLDEIFGAGNFLGCAVWNKGPVSGGEKHLLPRFHNYVVIYAKDRRRASPWNSLTSWWTSEGFGDSEEARQELGTLFPESRGLFGIPKPVRLIQKIVQAATEPATQDIVLDCFAGSGTTAHAVLRQNATDGGDRRFILVEMEDYTESLTAVRVRRAIQREEEQAHEFFETGFEYLELDVPPSHGE